MPRIHFILKLAVFLYCIIPSEEACTTELVADEDLYTCPNNGYCYMKRHRQSTITCMNITLDNNSDELEVNGDHTDVATSLVFYDSNITVIPSRTVNIYKTIKILNIANSYVKSIERKAFRGLTSLEQLDLQNNLISNISKGTFDNLTSLFDLNLRNCKLTHLEEHIFSDLTQLETLDLSFNMITQIPSNTFVTTKALKSLLLNDNLISTIQAELISDIGESGIFLNLSSNNIQFIDVSKMKGTIDLSFNLLTKITILNVNITYFDASHNALSTLPESAFQYSPNLDQIILNHDNLTEIHEDLFANLKELRKLQLSGNKLQELHVGLFRDLTKLLELDLSHNHIEHFEIGLFSSLHQLQRLNIGSNKILDLETTLLYPLTNIKNLDISNNSCSELVVQNIFTYVADTRLNIDYIIYDPDMTININNNNLSCAWLMKTLRAPNHNFVLVIGTSFKVNNINGIACISPAKTSTTIKRSSAPSEIQDKLYSVCKSLEQFDEFTIPPIIL